MKRYIVVKEQGGSRVSHGTALYSKVVGFITSDALSEGAGINYFLSTSGELHGGIPILSVSERFVAAPGCATPSMAPFVYELEIGAIP